MATAFCRSILNYIDVASGGAPAPMVVDILDGRAADLPGWERCGFQLVAHTSAVRDWSDDVQIAAVHHSELEVLARELTGCDHATVSGHIKRGPEQAAHHADLAPIEFVHSDFAAGSEALIRRSGREGPRDTVVPAMSRNGLTAESHEDARRIVVMQFRRHLGPPRMDLRSGSATPARSSSTTPGRSSCATTPAPEVPTSRRWQSWPPPSRVVTAGTRPDLCPDEVVVFRTYDTELVRAGRTYFTPHAAFCDPALALGEPARSSIELRAVCLFS